MFHRLDHRAGHYLLLAAVWALLCLPNLGGPSLWDIDEGNNSECFREMLDSGNLVVPTFNYALRCDKPVLLYWAQIACAQLVGVNEWSARLPSALAALLTVLAIYELGRRMFTARAGLWAGLVLGTSVAFLGAAHFANPDALLLAFGTLALALFWHDVQSAGRGWLGAVGVCAGLAVLAKGPVGLVLPAGVAILFLAWQRRLRHLWDVRVGWFVFLLLLTAVPWYALVTAETRGAWLGGFLRHHNINRATSALEGHSGPWYYYLPVLLAGLAPWSIFLFTALWHAWRRLRQGDDREALAVRFLIVWFAVYLVFFSAVRTKLPNYVLPVYPALALLTGHLLERWRLGEFVLPAWLQRSALVCLALLGVLVAGGLLVAGGAVELGVLRGRSFPELLPWAWLGVVPPAGAALAGWSLRRGWRGGVIAAVAGSAVAFALPLTAWGIGVLDARKAPRPLARALPADHLHHEVRLGAYDWFLPSMVFYGRREVHRLEKPAQVEEFLNWPMPNYLFIPEQTWQEVQRTTTARGRVLARHRDLESGRLILLVVNDPGSDPPGVASSRPRPQREPGRP